MDLSWSAEEEAFRGEVRDFLAQELTDGLREAAARCTSVYAPPELALAWQAILHRRGWAAPAWPVEWGGCGWDPARRRIFAEEMSAAGAPPLSPMGLAMCGPVLIGHGTQEQKARFLPRILSGEDFWCQGYSERGAGSDLASLQMKATDDGDALVLDGHKIWTTHAHAANWMFCLVRTSQEAIPQRGITFVLVAMTSPGIETRPIFFISGEAVQCEVFFDGVRVPKSQVVGEIGKGWTVAKYLLEFERGGSVAAPGLRGALDRLVRLARETEGGQGSDLLRAGTVGSRLAALSAEIDSFEGAELRLLAESGRGASPGAISSMMKTVSTELSQRMTEMAVELAGAYAAPFQPAATLPGGAVLPGASNAEPVGPAATRTAAARQFNNRAASIYAGSNEIQRNILAKAVLGL